MRLRGEQIEMNPHTARRVKPQRYGNWRRICGAGLLAAAGWLSVNWLSVNLSAAAEPAFPGRPFPQSPFPLNLPVQGKFAQGEFAKTGLSEDRLRESLVRAAENQNAEGAEGEEKPSEPPPPLTIDQIESLIMAGVRPRDILAEVEARGLSEPMTLEALEKLRRVGAGEPLLVDLSEAKGPMAPQFLDALRSLLDGEYEQAIKSSREVFASSPRNLGALWIAAKCRYDMGEYQAAADNFTQIREIDPSYRFTTVLIQTRDGKETRRSPDELLAPVSVWLGRSLVKLNRLEDASRVLSADAGNNLLLALAERSRVFERLGRFQRAEEDLTQVLCRIAYWSDGHARLAMLLAAGPNHDLSRASDLAAAADLLAEETGTTRAAASAAMAALLAARGEFTGAENYADQAVKESEKDDPDNRALYQAVQQACKDHRPFSLAAFWESYNGGGNPGGTSATVEDSGVKGPAEDAPAVAAEVMAARIADKMKRLDGGKLSNGPQVGPFSIASHEVTREEWAAIMGEPSPENPKLPQDGINWDDVQEFLKRLNTQLGATRVVYRLPTAEEWRWAAAADKKTPFYFGSDAAPLEQHAWYIANSGRKLHPVGEKRPNDQGLYDIYGNVAEFVQVPEIPSETSGLFRRYFGGSIFHSDKYCRSTAESFGMVGAKDRMAGIGFRLAADADATLTPQPKTQASGLGLLVDRLMRDLEVEASPARRALLRESELKLLYLRSYLAFRQKQWTQAIEDLRRIRELASQVSEVSEVNYDVLARCLLGWIYATADDASIRQGEEARRLIEPVLGVGDFKTWLPFAVLAASLGETGDFSSAVDRAKSAKASTRPKFKSFCDELIQRLEKKEKLTGMQLPFIAPGQELIAEE